MRSRIKKQDVKQMIVRYFHEHGYAPSYREIGDELGIKSTSNVSDWLSKLFIDNTIISDAPEGTPRAFRLCADWHEYFTEMTRGYVCTACEHPNDEMTAYCPYCGSKMANYWGR